MKSKEQIEQRLSEALDELQHLQDWSNKAYIAWTKEYKMWGDQADRADIDQAHEAHQLCHMEVQTLQWVLNNQN